MELTPLFSFTAGVFATAHCLGMCGGISGALAASVARGNARTWHFVLAYNSGRLTSYTFAGALAGALASTGALMPGSTSHLALAIPIFISSALMAGMGLYLTGWFPQFAYVEKIGVPLWRRLEPLGRQFLPPRTLVHAFAFGLIWGWLPCGLVYTALLWAATTASPWQGALNMFAFGLGTFPALFSTALFGGLLWRFARSPWTRRSAGILLVILAILNLFWQ